MIHILQSSKMSVNILSWRKKGKIAIIRTMFEGLRIWGIWFFSHVEDGSMQSHIIKAFMAIRKQICSGFTILKPKSDSEYNGIRVIVESFHSLARYQCSQDPCPMTMHATQLTWDIECFSYPLIAAFEIHQPKGKSSGR